MTSRCFNDIGDMIAHHASHRGGQPALLFEGRTTSYRDLDAHARDVAAALVAAGCGKGARVAYLGKNGDLFFELLIGAALAGVVLVPLNWRLAEPELRGILADSQAVMLFATAEYRDLARSLAQTASGEIPVIDMEPEMFARWRGTGDAAGRRPEGTRSDVFLQLYTSGTTGNPKGVMLSQNAFLNALEAADSSGEYWRIWTPDMVSLMAMPAFHVSGTGWALGALYGGAKSVILPEFSIDSVERALSDHGVTHMMVVPAALQILVEKWEAAGSAPGTLRQIVYGASPMSPALLKRCLAMLACDFLQYYGMTETFGSVVALPPSDHVAPSGERLASTGRAMSGNSIRVIAADGDDAPPHGVGEVLIRSGAAMDGYWGLPDETARTIDADGWLHTGDAGYLDTEGYLYLCDRIKDMIISGGENIYPTEVENAILTHAAIREAAVIGVPDERWGEAVKAVVVLKDGAEIDAAALIAHVRQLVAGYKTPRSVDFVSSLPRNSSGKLLKRELRAPYWQGQTRAIA